MFKKGLIAAIFVASNLCQSQQLSEITEISSQLATPHHQVNYGGLATSDALDVGWAKGYLVSFSPGEMKEPVSLYGRDGKAIFETWLTFQEASRVYLQDAAASNRGRVIVAASAAAKDGSIADMIVELDADGIRHVIRTTPFYPLKVCQNDDGTVWAYGKELSPDRRSEVRGDYPMLRAYSLEKGELRAVLNRSTVNPPPRVPVNGAKNDVYIKCTADKVALVLGPTNELVQVELPTGKISRLPITPLPEGTYFTGAALTESGDIYLSTLCPGKAATSAVMRASLDGKEAKFLYMRNLSSGNQALRLLGSDGEDLVYTQGRHNPTLFWSTMTGR